jgi:molybdopterin-guanine dinucleotide biosynthesis protein A
LTTSCDVLGLTDTMIAALHPAPAFLAGHPVIGLWPATLANGLAQRLAKPGNRSVYGFADHVGARRVPGDSGLTNINSPVDLARRPD